MSPQVSIICSVYNRPEFLEKKILSLRNQTFNNFELVLADDGSGPEIREVVQRYSSSLAYPIVHVAQDHRGFRKAIICNQAVLRSQADYLVFTDHDCLHHHRHIERHYRHRKMRTVVCGRRVQITEQGNLSISNADIVSRRIEDPAFIREHATRKTLKYAYYRPWMTMLTQKRSHKVFFLGCNFSMSKDDFYSFNGFDERIDYPGEDTNLFARLLKRNYHVKYLAHEAILYHFSHGKGYEMSETPHGAFDNPEVAWTEYGLFRTLCRRRGE